MAKKRKEHGIEEEEPIMNIYAPIYTPKGDKPSEEELFDCHKYYTLMDEINKSNVSDKEKEFLLLAVTRHIVFYYDKIAEYYCHVSPEMQDLMEKLALVIIDFDKAIEYGYLKLSKELIKQFKKEHRDVGTGE